jgi:hypothetical protein
MPAKKSRLLAVRSKTTPQPPSSTAALMVLPNAVKLTGWMGGGLLGAPRHVGAFEDLGFRLQLVAGPWDSAGLEPLPHRFRVTNCRNLDFAWLLLSVRQLRQFGKVPQFEAPDRAGRSSTRPVAVRMILVGGGRSPRS